MMNFSQFVDQMKKRSLGIDRQMMPQIPKVDYDAFVTWARNKGIGVTEGADVDPNTLMPVQQTYKPLSLEQLLQITDLARPIVISADNYIIDGHHRYIVSMYKNLPTIKCTVLDVNVLDALNLAREFEVDGN